MQRFRPPSSHVRRRAGFTLTEITIVLTIMALLVAGIFTAAGYVYRRIRINQASDELTLTASKMRDLYSGQNVTAVTTKTATVVTPTLVTQTVFPSEMLDPSSGGNIPCAGTVANNPWSYIAGSCGAGGSTLGSARIAIFAGNYAVSPAVPAQFAIEYINVPVDACVEMLVRNSMPGPETKLLQVKVGANAALTAAAGQLPVSATTADAQCGGAGPFTIDWYYQLGG